MQGNPSAPYTWQKGRQPRQTVKLNRKHPLSRGLGGAWIGSQVGINQLPIDMVNKCDFNAISGAGLISQSVGTGGTGPRNTATSYIHTPHCPALSTTRYTALFVGEIVSMTPSYAGLFAKNAANGNDAEAGGGYALQKNASVDNFVVFHVVTSSYIASSASTVMKPSTISGKGLVAVGMSYGGSGINLYFNGVLQENLTISGDPAITDGYVVMFNPRDLSTSLTSIGIMNALLMWNRQLSDAEMMSISKDPYQIFDPIVTQPMGIAQIIAAIRKKVMSVFMT